MTRSEKADLDIRAGLGIMNIALLFWIVALAVCLKFGLVTKFTTVPLTDLNNPLIAFTGYTLIFFFIFQKGLDVRQKGLQALMAVPCSLCDTLIEIGDPVTLSGMLLCCTNPLCKCPSIRLAGFWMPGKKNGYVGLLPERIEEALLVLELRREKQKFDEQMALLKSAVFGATK